MQIGAIQKFSMIDYQDKICAIIFTEGCNFRCPYCHNPELIEDSGNKIRPTKSEIIDFLKTRIGKLDAVSITGGEPTIHSDLPDFIREIKNMGFLIKLDTNGTNPKMIEFLIKDKLINYFAMDIKAPLEKYEIITNLPVDTNKIKKSIELIKDSGIDYEFRTTIVDMILDVEDILQIKRLLGNVKSYYLQDFVSTKTLDKSFNNYSTFSEDKKMVLIDKFNKSDINFAVR